MHMLQLNALRVQHCHTESPATETFIMASHSLGPRNKRRSILWLLIMFYQLVKPMAR